MIGDIISNAVPDLNVRGKCIGSASFIIAVTFATRNFSYTNNKSTEFSQPPPPLNERASLDDGLGGQQY
jgi:hypothetical protein